VAKLTEQDLEDAEQAAYLADWRQRHPNGGCLAVMMLTFAVLCVLCARS